MNFDGHDREDVVAYRNKFLGELDLLDKKSITFDGIVPEFPVGEKPLIRVVHDESTYYGNCDLFGRRTHKRLAIEVSGFINNGFRIY